MTPNDIPANDQAKLSPTEMPFTSEDFDPQLEDALELLPDMLDNDRVEIQYAINGLISLTPYSSPVIGETPELKGLSSAAAVWSLMCGAVPLKDSTRYMESSIRTSSGNHRETID